MGPIQKIWNYITKPRIDYEPLIEVRIFRDAILHNLHEYQKQYPKFKFAPVLKSNAYGHGLAVVGKILDREDMAFFTVDSFYEALTLRQHGVRSKILVLGYERIEHLVHPPLKDCAPAIADLRLLEEVIKKLQKPVAFHLKIDTGMHRQGVLLEDAERAITLIKSNANFVLEGLCSHFADADGTDKTFTAQQIVKWNNAVATFKENFSTIKFFHTSNTAGAHFSENIDANVGRLGLGLYGINSSPFAKLNLQPALEMASVISSVKEIPPGEKVGYGITFESVKSMRVATVPAGYNEGVDRRLSNKGFYKIGKTFCPLVGRVSMNISSVDVSEIPEAKIEDEVIIISAQPEDKNSVEAIAELCGCISYEVLVRIPQYLRRVVV